MTSTKCTALFLWRWAEIARVRYEIVLSGFRQSSSRRGNINTTAANHRVYGRINKGW